MGFESFFHGVRHAAARVLGTFGHIARKVGDFGGAVARKIGDFAPPIADFGSKMALMLGQPAAASAISGVGRTIGDYAPSVEAIFRKIGYAGDAATGIGNVLSR